ncbi:MAG: PIN domain-containing protein [bacterium]|nr:PIN domain-containing protein [bacterium]
MIQPPLLVDSSAWIALLDSSDSLHSRALEFWRTSLKDRRRFLTSDYVLDESYTFLRRRRNGMAMAIALHDRVLSSQLVEVAEIDEGLRSHAWEIFVGYEDKVLSFTDCTSFALMRERRLLDAFTFDDDFHRAGFVVRPRAD